ncbi:efflux RND transporter periplasmic adaptor subunit [Chondrinema litorale]|uniref:efflux RND transporter periplasmic adaptor subunit n=1 Tax=Chondrinema litorale TaxID=2994555 RepID=UPI0025431032|nr:efflux RND transporter periplasmic adaptor subunit [Chondrinema litorale]UZR93070.1 efflux RND transporter periplasmic adaptor subunit [Chondrinema litorale]
MKLIQLFLIAAAVFVFSSCENDKAANTESTEAATQEQNAESNSSSNVVSLNADQVKMAGIKSGKIEKKTISAKVKCSGMIDVPPEGIASIHPVMEGFVKAVKVLEGEKVSRGQVLGILEDPAYITLQEEYLKVNSKLKFAEKEYERQQKLSDENATALKTFQQVESDFAVLKSEAAGLKARLNMLGLDTEQIKAGKIQEVIYIKSPFNGTVAGVELNIGQHVDAQTEAFKVVNKDHIHGELNVFTRDILKIKKGQKVRFTVNGSDKHFEGEVFLIGETVNEENNTVNVHIDPIGDVSLLKLGMFISAEIMVSDAEQDAVPELSVVKDEENSFIFIDRGNYTYEKYPVKAGTVMDGYCAVDGIENLSEGVNVVTQGANYIWASL